MVTANKFKCQSPLQVHILHVKNSNLYAGTHIYYVILYVFFGKIHEHVVVHLICLCLETERGGIRFT